MLRSLSLQGRLAVLVVAAILPLAALSVWFAVGSAQKLLLLAIALLAGVTAAWWIGGRAFEFARPNEQGDSGAECALRSSNQELEAFSYSVSHDLRAPLGAIGGFGRALALKLEGHPDDRVRHYLERIQAGVEKMEQLIESLLSLAKVARAPLNYGSQDLSAMAREVVEGLRMQHPEREVSIRVHDGLVAQGDPRLLRVVLENLVGNAWKFTSRTQGALVEVGKLEDSGEFFVRDNGVGFDMAYAGKLFGAFQRLHTESEFPGTGIGLATVRRIVARHQGRVWAESLLGQGTTFFFTLSESAPPAWLAGDTAAVLSRREAVDAVLAQRAAQLAREPQGMQMGDRFAHGKRGLVQVELALEHDRAARRPPTAGLCAQASTTSASRSRWWSCSWRMRSCKPRNGLPCEGSVRVSSGRRGELVDGVEEGLERVGLRLHVVDADVGRDARQHHVAADQHLQVLAVQRDVLGRVAVAADAAPVAPADANRVAVLHAPESARDLRHHAGVVVGRGPGSSPPTPDRSGRARQRSCAACSPPKPVVLCDAIRAALKSVALIHSGAFQRSHSHSGQPDVVGVHVGHDHAQDRQALQLRRENLLPLGLGLVRG